MAAEVAAIWGLMADLVAGIWYIPAIIAGGCLIVALIQAVKRGSGV